MDERDTVMRFLLEPARIHIFDPCVDILLHRSSDFFGKTKCVSGQYVLFLPSPELVVIPIRTVKFVNKMLRRYDRYASFPKMRPQLKTSLGLS